jgi:hypothetical protein
VENYQPQDVDISHFRLEQRAEALCIAGRCNALCEFAPSLQSAPSHKKNPGPIHLCGGLRQIGQNKKTIG